MAKNSNMHAAKKAKNDEFYTLISDIENEVMRYKDQFKGKVVFCNCDDPEKSNFWKFFELNFDNFGLKKLMSTHFDDTNQSYKLEIIGDISGDGKVTEKDIIKTPLTQNGDFRSPECIVLLQEADIVVTNPPFSLFREYIAQLMEYEKKFLVIGNTNAITYKETFKLIKEGKVYLGITYPKSFIQPDGTTAKFGNIGWFTNLEITKKPDIPILTKTYNPKDYPQYDNYQAINVNKVKEIPYDYNGVMGVPITILGLQYSDGYIHMLDNLSEEMKFEVLGIANSARWIDYECFTLINGKKIYNRVLIKKV